MRPADAGINAPEKLDKDGKPVDQFVCIDAETNQPAITDNCSKGVLDFEGEVNGVKVRTGFAILTESVNEYTIEEYSEITGVSVEVLDAAAHEAQNFLHGSVFLPGNRVKFQFAISENESKSKKKRDFKSIDCAKLKWC